MNTASLFRPSSRPGHWLRQNTAGLLLAFLAMSVWFAVALAGHLAPPSGGRISIPRQALEAAHRIRLDTPANAYIGFDVVFSAREDVELQWRGGAESPTWTVKGESLVITPPAHDMNMIVLAVPVRLNQIVGQRLKVSTEAGLQLDQLQITANHADVKGQIGQLELTLGHPKCGDAVAPKDAIRYSQSAHADINSEGIQQLVMRAASGEIRLSSLSSLTAATISVAPGVGLAVDDAAQLSRLRLESLSPEMTGQWQWADSNCPKRTQ